MAENINQNGIYGQFNQSIEKCKDLLLMNDDLIKFLYYKDSDFDIRNQKFKVDNKIKNYVKNNQFLYYNSLEDRQSHTYIIIDMGKVNREEGFHADVVEQNFLEMRMYVYICCHDDLCNTVNGDRIRCIEQCIQDVCTNAEVDKSFHCWVGSSNPVSVAENYKCRLVPILFSYFNTSRKW